MNLEKNLPQFAVIWYFHGLRRDGASVKVYEKSNIIVTFDQKIILCHYDILPKLFNVTVTFYQNYLMSHFIKNWVRPKPIYP